MWLRERQLYQALLRRTLAHVPLASYLVPETWTYEPPFRLKTVDHTRETRSVLNLEHSDQDYGASFDFVFEVFSLSFMPFIKG